MACLVLVNLLIAQAIVGVYYPTSVARLGPAVLAALALVTVGAIVYAIMGWRSYLHRPPE